MIVFTGIRIDIEMDTHVVANLEFTGGAVGTLVMSFDVWDSNLPRMEIYGSKGTLCMAEQIPLPALTCLAAKRS